MKNLRLGQTNIVVSPLGLGTVKIGRNKKVKYPCGEDFPLPSNNKVEELLNVALSLGINVIDTAPAYGNSEERLGSLLGNHRKDFVIISKAGEEFQNGLSYYDFSEKHIKLCVERSLKRLKTDYIECILVHSNRNDLYVLENTPALETLSRFKERGDILSYGMSLYTVECGIKALESCDILMVTYNLRDKSMYPVIERANKLNKGILVKKGLLSGHFSQSNHGSNLTDCIKEVFKVPGVHSLMVGSLNPEHLRQNVHILENVLKWNQEKTVETV
ncbi:MAG: aldo/keto reductase [Thermodesulfovibrionia bacterium]